MCVGGGGVETGESCKSVRCGIRADRVGPLGLLGLPCFH